MVTCSVNSPPEQIIQAYESKKGLLWGNISEITAEDGQFLEQDLHLHTLAVEDCVSCDIHPPRIDDFTDYLFVVVHGINHVIESGTVETAEMGMFLGKRFVISNHNYPSYSVSYVQHRLGENDRLMLGGIAFFSGVTANLASFLIKGKDSDKKDINRLVKEVERLRQELSRLRPE